MDDPTPPSNSNQMTEPALHGSREMFDINILPQRYQRRKITLFLILPWLILIFLAGAIYPSYNLARASQILFQGKRLELAQAQVKLDFFQTNNQELADLQSEIDSLTAERDAILDSYGNLNLSSEEWNQTLSQIDLTIPDGITMDQISRFENEYRLEGIASDYKLVINLSDALGHLEGLNGVEIDSIEQVVLDEETPTAVADLEENTETLSEPIYYAFTILASAAGEVEP